jgi:hypothetical protein
MTDSQASMEHKILYDLWFEYASALVERVIAACELSDEKAAVMRQIYLRPNDYRIVVK